MGASGPVRRAVTGCSQQVVVELEGRGDNVDEGQVESEISSRITKDVSVSTRQGRFDADKEIVAATRGSIVLMEDVLGIVEAVRQSIIDQNLSFEVSEWRVEAT